MWKSSLSVCCALALSAGQVLACAFHNYSPQPTLVDRLLASEHIVLARSSADAPFRYSPTEAIQGPLEGVEIPDLVDVKTRRQFLNDTNTQVLFARDGSYGPWERLATVDPAFAPILDDIIARLPDWELGDDLDRFEFFANLLGHDDTEVRRLALLELDMADYSVLRQLDLSRMDAQAIASRLNILPELELKPIRILLLGFADGPDVSERLKSGLLSSVAGGGPFLGAYATALIEQDGVSAVDWLWDQVLAQDDLSVEAREVLVEALAIHSIAGDQTTQQAIADALDQSLSTNAALAPAVARQYGFRADWSHRDRLESLLRARAFTSPGDIIIVTQYVALADEMN